MPQAGLGIKAIRPRRQRDYAIRVRSGEPLFFRGDSLSVARSQQAALGKEVAEYEPESLLSAGIEGLLAYFEQKYEVDVPILDASGIEVTQEKSLPRSRGTSHGFDGLARPLPTTCHSRAPKTLAFAISPDAFRNVMSDHLLAMRTLAIVVAAVLASSCSGPAASGARTSTPSPTASAAPSPSAPASPSPTPSPDSSPSARPGVTARGASLPAAYQLMAIRSDDVAGERRRLVALDLTGAHRHVEIASWQMPARMVNTWGAAFSASSEGGRVAITATGTKGASALYLLDTATGRVRTLFDEAAEHASSPVLSDDGRRIAFLRLPVAQNASSVTETGIVAGATEDPASWRRVVAPQPPATMAPLAWSADAKWLAFVRLFIGGSVSLVRSDGSETIEVGRGTDVHWRSWGPRLLVSGPSNGGGGTGVWAYDVTSRTLRQIAAPSDSRSTVSAARWHPLLERVLYVETTGPASPGVVWTRYADGRNSKVIARASFVFDVHWSSDGTRIYATFGGDDSTFSVGELLTGALVTRACWRGELAAPVCP